MTTAMQTLTVEQSKEVLEIMTRECRDLLDNLVDKGVLNDMPNDTRNEIIRDHFAMDNSGYGISVEEWLPGIDEQKRIEIVDKVLASIEYND